MIQKNSGKKHFRAYLSGKVHPSFLPGFLPSFLTPSSSFPTFSPSIYLSSMSSFLHFHVLIPSFTPPFHPCIGIHIKLDGGGGPSRGTVVVSYKARGGQGQMFTGPVCDVSWTIEDADVACRMLGYR